ncbi:hypothetical protein, partial [Sinorhizobium meliloti]
GNYGMLFNMADKYFGLHRWLWEQSDKDCEGGVGYPATSPVGNGGTVHIAGSDPRSSLPQKGAVAPSLCDARSDSGMRGPSEGAGREV